jgi:hypothetical protein
MLLLCATSPEERERERERAGERAGGRAGGGQRKSAQATQHTLESNKQTTTKRKKKGERRPQIATHANLLPTRPALRRD